MRIIVRIMSTNLIKSLFPKTRTKILSTILLDPNHWWYLRDLAKHLELTTSSLQREMLSLKTSGILENKHDGNRVYYRANLQCPIFKELQSIFIKTYGLRDLLFEFLSKHEKKIQFAFIYGSIARGEEVAESDVDLMIIGDIALSDFGKKLNTLEDKLRREINPTIYPPKDFKNKLNNNHFIKEVVSREKIFIIGTNEEFEQFIS